MNKKTMRSPLNIFAAALALVFVGLLFAPRSDNQLIGGDTTYYYATTRTIVMDGDFDFSNDVEIYNQRIKGTAAVILVDQYVFAIGPSLLWLPFFIIGHWLAMGLSFLDLNIIPDGYSMFEQAVVSLGGFLYGLAGWFIIAAMLKRRVSPDIAEWGVIITVLSTSAIFYIIIQPLMSHATEMFSVGVFLYLLYMGNTSKYRTWLIIGAAWGLVTIVRWQYLPFGLLILPELRKSVLTNNNSGRLKLIGYHSILCIIGFFMVAFIQMFYWYKTLGAWVTIPDYATYGEEFFSTFHSHWWDVLFSTRGWFVWHPINLVGVAGLIWLSRKGEYIFPLLVIAMEVYICGSIANWLSPWSFGQRRLIGLLPFTAMGFSYLLEHFRGTKYAKALWGFAALSALWNFAFLVQYILRLIPMTGTLTIKQLIWDKMMLPRTILNRFIP